MGISSFWIIRVVNSQLAWYSHVRCNPLTPSQHPQNTPHMTITNFNYEGSYLPGLICHMDVKADLGRSPGRSTPTPQMHHWRYIMGCFWQPWLPKTSHKFWILQEKVGISFYFCIIRVVNSQLALYSDVRCNPLNTPTPLKHLQNTPTWQLQMSTMRTPICQVLYVILLLKLILADFLADVPSYPQNASWDIYYGIDLTAILDSSRKGGNFFFFLNN